MAILRIDHIAVVIPEINDALSFWKEALGLAVEGIEEVPEQETVVAFMPVGESKVELVQPTTQGSGMAKYMEKRGAGLHHICFEVDDIEATLVQLKAKGIQLINEEPVIGAGGKKVAFIHPKSASGVLIELTESQEML